MSDEAVPGEIRDGAGRGALGLRGSIILERECKVGDCAQLIVWEAIEWAQMEKGRTKYSVWGSSSNSRK